MEKYSTVRKIVLAPINIEEMYNVCKIVFKLFGIKPDLRHLRWKKAAKVRKRPRITS